MLAVANYALLAMQLVPAITKGTVGALEAFTSAKSKVEHFVATQTEPTQADWDELNAETKRLLAELDRDQA